MRGALPLPVVLLLLALPGCGSDLRRVMAGSYVLGNPHTARFKANYFQARSRGSFMVNDHYVTSDLIDPLLESTDAVLLLKSSGRFTYDGPPRVGEDELQLAGTWSYDDDVLRLRVETAGPQHALSKTTIVCSYRPGMISYPADPEAESPVYFDLALDRELIKVPAGIAGVRAEPGR